MTQEKLNKANELSAELRQYKQLLQGLEDGSCKLGFMSYRTHLLPKGIQNLLKEMTNHVIQVTANLKNLTEEELESL